MMLSYFNAAGADVDGEIGDERPVETHLIPLLFDAVLGIRPPLKVLGNDYPTADGTAIRNYFHVADLATAHLNALHCLRAGGQPVIANRGASVGYSVKAVIAAESRVAGCQVPHVFDARRPGNPAELVADSSLARFTLELLPLNLCGLDRIIETAWAWQMRRGTTPALPPADDRSAVTYRMPNSPFGDPLAPDVPSCRSVVDRGDIAAPRYAAPWTLAPVQFARISYVMQVLFRAGPWGCLGAEKAVRPQLAGRSRT